MAQPARNDVQSGNDWTLAAVGLLVTLIVAALFFRQLTIEYSTTLLYWLWSLADVPRFHADAAWRINLLAATHNNAEATTWAEFFAVMDRTAGILMLAMVPLAVTGVTAVRRHQVSRTRRDISIRTLPRIMADFSPAIVPALTYGDKDTQLLNVDPQEHRSAQTPDEFAIEHRLVVNRQLRRQLAEQKFIAQLGTALVNTNEDADRKNQLIPEFLQFNDHERAMFAVFGLQHFMDKRQQAEALLDALNRSTLHADRRYKNKVGYPNLSLAAAAFRQVADLPAAQAWVRQYGYVRTAISALHDNDLHLPIRRFRWLKGLDRTLWYTLASTGRPWPFVEAAGVVSQAHWETLAARYRVRLTRPVMSHALDGLETDLRNIGAVVDITPKAPRTVADDEDDYEDETPSGNDTPPDEQHVNRHVHSFRPKMR
ncbi:secretion/conjugation apparatus DotM-related subunit [Erwinia sp. LJJL01]|uniref:secretion/conjugation apparatus DotM-related subunit n=1 Tax=Erwinia sp. LJJL01 TaxID=3391839 RepID=UPI00105C6BD3